MSTTRALITYLTTAILTPLTTIPNQSFGNYEVLYQWRQVDYNFPSDAIRENVIRSSGFLPVNCAITGIKVYEDALFLATPRYRPGVPSTLNLLRYSEQSGSGNSSDGPRLTPFPSWEMQEIGNCKALQLVQAMEVDIYGRLWIVDAGRVDLLTPNPRNLCPAKLVIFDLEQNKIDRIHQFPFGVAPRDTSALKDIQVACHDRDDCFAYISNLNGTCSIVVYDYWNDDSWYATHSSMQPDLGRAAMTIDFITAVVPFGITGLGLTPSYTNYSTIYYSKIAGDRIYTVPTALLNDGNTLKYNPTLPDSAVQDLGVKPMGQADGTAMDNRGRWFFGSLPESAVYSLDIIDHPSLQIPKAQRRVQSSQEMQWPDTFTFDNYGNLLFTTTRFQRYSQMIVNPNEINYRVIRMKTDSLAYFADAYEK